jgi:phosphoribosylaminoimidazole-succinocarboxamide synthase
MKKLILTGIWLLCGFLLPAQELEQNVEERLQTFFREYTTHTANIGTCNPDNDFLLPEEVVTKTVDKYKEAYELLTGKPFTR